MLTFDYKAHFTQEFFAPLEELHKGRAAKKRQPINFTDALKWKRQRQPGGGDLINMADQEREIYKLERWMWLTLCISSFPMQPPFNYAISYPSIGETLMFNAEHVDTRDGKHGLVISCASIKARIIKFIWRSVDSNLISQYSRQRY